MEQIIITTLAVSTLTALLVSYLLYRTIYASKRDASTLVFVDTSVLIDARIVSIAKTGFVPGKLIIPRSVIGELQYMADNADSEKRTKARRGLDVIKELQDVEQITVEIFQDGSHAKEGVDERLLKHAKERGGYLCTIDYNLNKVAQVEGIPVLNVNELAQQIRIVYLPGDNISLVLTQKGQDSHQAVGHLEDGTMVVVEHSKEFIGQTTDVTVIRSLQTAAGRMIFAKRTGATADNRQKKTNKPTNRANNTGSKKQAAKKKDSSKLTERKSPTTSGQRSRRSPSSKNREDELIHLANNQK